MITSAPEYVLQRMVRALVSGDARDCAEYVAASYLDHQGRGGKPLRGPEGFRQVVRAAHRTTMPDIVIEDLVADGVLAAARLRWRFEASGEGGAVERETLEMVRVEDGRAVEHWGAEAWSRRMPPEAV